MKNTPLEQYQLDSVERVKRYKENTSLQKASEDFFEQIGIGQAEYVYNFFWLGVPIIQIPQDLQAMQEIIWRVKPDLIIETGIAWGGRLIFSASMLAILEACKSIQNGHVLGIDIDIRPHNKKSILRHPLSHKITMLEGSSTDDKIIKQVKSFTKNYKKIMVCLDSNHTHSHVLAELEAYAPCVSLGSYCIVDDTVIEDAPEEMSSNRPWGKGNNPKTAVWEFLKEHEEFVMDKDIENKLLITGSPDGYLKRVK
jgi:cephalosporin hydroxylase